MWFWWFMLIMSLLLPLTMLFLGLRFLKKPPKHINHIYGYRTTMSMKSDQTWAFAHRFCGKLWLVFGSCLLPVSLCVLLCVRTTSVDTIGLVGGILVVLQLLPLLLSIIPTELALRKNFDSYGRQKSR